MGAVGDARIDVQLVGKLQAVVNVLGFTGDVSGGTVVLDATANASDYALLEQGGEFVLRLLVQQIRHRRSPVCRGLVW